MTQTPLVVLDLSGLWKKLSADKRRISFFFLSPEVRDEQPSIEVTGGGSAGSISAVSKSFFFSKGIRRRWREERETENVAVFKDHRDLTVSARETESKVQRSLTSNVFQSHDLQFTIWEISINV